MQHFKVLQLSHCLINMLCTFIKVVSQLVSYENCRASVFANYGNKIVRLLY